MLLTRSVVLPEFPLPCLNVCFQPLSGQPGNPLMPTVKAGVAHDLLTSVDVLYVEVDPIVRTG